MSQETDVTVEKCREKFKLVASLEREEEGHKEKAKAVRKSIENLQSEIRRLITEDQNQTELHLGKTVWRCQACAAEFEENPGELHQVEIKDADGTVRSTIDCGPVVGFAAETPSTH